MRVLRVTLVALAPAFLSCLADVNVEGKRCPCPDDFPCDPVTNTCQRARGCPPQFVVTDFAVDWVTANAIRWRWEPPQDLSSFGYYELWTGEGELMSADLEAPSRRWTGSDNPELSTRAIPHAATLRPVKGTITDGLLESRAYWGRLVAYDNAGCASFSQPLGTRTQFVTRSIDVLVDNPPSFIYATPDGQCEHVKSDCFAGAGCARCSLPTPNVIHIEIVKMDWSAVGPDVNTTAMLEFSVRNEGPPSMWTHPFLGLGSPFYSAGFEPISLRGSNEYRVVQIPIGALRTGPEGEDRLVDESDTKASLNALNLYGDWANSIVSIDEIRIRY